MGRSWSRKDNPAVPGTGRTRVPRTPIGTERGGGWVDHALHQEAVHFIPGVCLVLFWLVGTLLHAFVVTTWSRAGTIALILLATAGMVASVWHTNKNHDVTGLWHGIATVVFGGGWLALCTLTGFVTIDPVPDGWLWWFGDRYTLTPHGFTIAIYGVGGVALAAVWNTRISHWRKGLAFAEWLSHQPSEVTPMEQAGHKGARLSLRRVNEFRSEGTLILGPGDTLVQFQRDLVAVETAHGFPPGSLTVHQRKGVRDARICDVTVMWDNPIAESQPWPGLAVAAGGAR